MSQLAQYRRPFWDTQPGYRFDPYGSTQLRSPNEPLIVVPQTLSEITGPAFGGAFVKQGDNDLTRIASAEAIGERIIVSGRVLDENGRPVPDALIEIWQANAAGRYLHKRDQHDAPLDPNFSGEGRTVTDAHGRYQFKTIKPGAYPWGNHYNGWRPQHIHFSLFGRAYATRLVTQMYFPGDPLLEFDPIFQCVPDVKARNRLVATLDWETTVPEYALGYRFDIVLRGRNATPME
ncbi:protocatechuate 3,4-dioxygenase subunit beta [Achromobacter sp. NPDC008082]|uniref:protocatechuate 3,4-dioxygenase subunit beta n=1 Tax=Achromobacter sp. NPDC008082 TaxID=3363888 RepID=UPI0036E1BA8A